MRQAIESVHEVSLLHITSDADHNRSVITFVGQGEAVVEAAVRAAAVARELIDLTSHRGVHPRLGALDVLPFAPLRHANIDDCVRLAREAAERIWAEVGIPIYFYEAAALRPDRVRLEDVRRGQFEGLRDSSLIDDTKAPDVGGPGLHPTAGAVIVGARKILIAYNINLKTANLAIAKNIARDIRTSSGGLPAVKALGLPLESRDMVQVSMNLTDFEQTSIHGVFEEVSRRAKHYKVEVAESEIIGLVPLKALEMAFAHWLKLANFQADNVIETRLSKSV